ncbi:alpha/beta fold hydrolase [Solirubrobacter phytolaccae]|uniref:Alpha/beta fold hydrolase n=1 Tax=Solirubrobacter phytolaccae TaxID=1404360 RepID=A0A9X3NAS6_9ACTN|nr:alpha/beta fold hydrolase [Solirubrobacter phytolaccae]MDA0181342.1 alpha/beta fold hydrolase [Solirubrobacter phytolaccae]
MKMSRRDVLQRLAVAVPAVAVGGALPPSAAAAEGDGFGPLVIRDQGGFAVGGSVVTTPGTFDPRRPTNPAGQTLHGDHARVFYQVPDRPRALPLVLWHGFKESGTSWGMTPDGREGFQTLFLRRRFAVYTLDQPRRGAAGRTTQRATVDIATDEQWFYNQFRLGLWPNLYPGVQFPDDPQALEQFFRQMVPDTGPIDGNLLRDGVSAVFDRIGRGILMTHSQACGFGWRTAMVNPRVKGVVALEPGSGFVFPEGEVPPPMPSSAGTLNGEAVSLANFRRLTRIPIAVYYGDNIPTEPTDIAGRDNWRVRLAMARLWVDAINRHGGDATLVHLPAVGIRGNTHFLFSDLNNERIARHIASFLARKGLS